MICPLCHTPNPDAAKFCSECGCDLRAQTGVLPVFPTVVAPAPSGAGVEGGSVPTVPLGGGAAGQTLAFSAEDRREGPAAMAPVGSEADTSGTERFASPLAAAAEGQRSVFSSGPGPASQLSQPDGERRLTRKQVTAIVIAAVLVALGCAAAGVTYALELWGGHSVPDVVGMTQAKAQETLGQAGFGATVLEVKSDDTENTVLLSDPAAGIRAAEGSTVSLHVATARVVPEVVGVPQAEAEALMAEEGFSNVAYEPEKSNEAEGTVLSVEPPAGTKGQAGTAIKVKVAQPFTVPDVAGQGRDEAVAALEAEGYQVTTAPVNTEEHPEGTAVTTEPPAGTKLGTGSPVTLYLAHNRSTELVDLTRKLLADAGSMTINGGTYEVRSVGDVSFAGGSDCSFTVTARPFEVVSVPWFLGGGSRTEYGADETIKGTVTWNDANRVTGAKCAAGAISFS